MSSGSQSSPSTNMNTSMQPPAQLLFTPLMISMVGVVSTALALLLYHIILSRYCLRRGRGRGRLRAALSRRFTWNNKASDGVDEKVLSTIPIISYSTAVGGLFGADRIECTVCLSEIEEGETVRLLPSCRHAFHVECIDEWFASHSNCPVCRASIVAPMSPVLPIATDLENLDSDEGSGDHAEGDDLSVSDRQVGSKSNGSLRHCASVVFPTEDKLASSKVLRRSASMDAPCVSLKVKPENEKETSSSSKAAGLVKSNSYKLRSLRRLWSNQSAQVIMEFFLVETQDTSKLM